MAMLTSTQQTQLSNLFSKVIENDEFEIMFNNYKTDNKLSIIKFMNVLKYLKYRSDNEKNNLVHEVVLDITFGYDSMVSYRVSITGIKEINDFLNLVHQRTNHIIFSILLTQSEFTQNPNVKYMKKTRDMRNIIDIDQYDIRFRKSIEEVLSEKEIKNILNLGLNSNSKIYFRFKNRLKLEILETANESIGIDLTIVQNSSNPNEITLAPKTYELELEYFVKKDKKESKEKFLNILLNEVAKIKKVLEGTDNLMSKEEMNVILEAYKKLVFFNDNSNTTNLYSMQPVSLEVQHILDKLPNRYSVTDKADGEKYQMFIFQKQVYLISNNMNVIKTNYTSKLSNTIIEGELIYFHDIKKYLFMAFDCLYYNNVDIRNEVNLKERMKNVINVCKDFNDIYEIKDYSGKFDLTNQMNYYNEEINKFYTKLNTLLDKSKVNDIIFYPKVFLYPLGASPSEVFNFAYNLWMFCTSNKLCPYKLDGIIFTGIEQKYSRDKRDHKLPIYKYKPPSTNSLDVYITFQRNLDTSRYLEIYDNSIGVTKDNKIYRVANISVGDNIGNKEVPVLFLKEENNHEMLFPVDRGEVRDVDGNIVQDNTVIEITYNNDPNIQHQYRWTILRTRWDKTESVIVHQKKYGNFKDVAIKTWKSMKEAILPTDIKNLANPDTFLQQQKILQSKLDSSVITSERQQDIYYQVHDELIKPMRAFHNWLKSVIIYTYCKPMKDFKDGKEHKTTVLDIGIGQGGDNMKYYHARVGELIGIEPDYYGLFSSTNGAVSRYNESKKKFPDFTNITFIHGSGSALFNGESQQKAIPNMSEDNKQLIDKVFKNKKFDVISSQFAIHYVFDTKNTINNLITNINNHLKVGGFVIFTLFDPKLVMDKLGDKDTFTSYYTDDDGNRKKLFEIKKKFNGKLEDKEGLAIDVHMGWIMEENKYETEYLVTEKLLTSTMEKAGCKIVDTDTFSNIYNINHPWFTNVIEHEANPKNLKFYKDVAQFFGDLKGVDKESKAYSFLSRYYVFQKHN